jgi:signal transduction histidine kinase
MKACIPEWERVHQALVALINKGQQYNLQYAINPADGSPSKIITSTARLERDQQGNPLEVLGFVQDITERKKAEEQLTNEKHLQQMLLDNFPGIVLLLRVQTREVVVSNRAGVKSGAVCGSTCFKTWGESQGPCEGCLAEDMWTTGNEQSSVIEVGGKVLEAHWVPVTDDLYLYYSFDITERELAEKERTELERQLHQSQKIESVGRLAGGVAHDYNNMLSVIIGRAELAQMRRPESASLHNDLDQILQAAIRSRNITQQLLAFARKQIITPRVLDLNETVESMLTMLKQLLGENIDLVWQPKEGLWPVEFDPSQMDQILANLCINARDSIADIGKMTIETDRVSLDKAYCRDHAGFIPGDFVMLAVSDDGCGMDKETLDKIFEPFFTTKPAGKGTGLGLAMVYGVVKQSNGFINVYSEPDEGTTFKIYLPRYMGPIAEECEAVGEELLRGQGETVLVVEDEISILTLIEEMLSDFGYKVLTASSPSEALYIASAHQGEIHLLVTDVVMPEMNGRVLAGRLQLKHPQLKCLYMSGYTADVIAHHGVLDKDIHFIQKPFSRIDFSVRIRTALGLNA